MKKQKQKSYQINLTHRTSKLNQNNFFNTQIQTFSPSLLSITTYYGQRFLITYIYIKFQVLGSETKIVSILTTY